MSVTTDRKLALAAFGAWLVSAGLSLATKPALLHDESQYALAARGDASWTYLSPGAVAIARAGVWLGGAPWQLRLVPLVFVAGLLVATWWLARSLYGERVGAWAVAIVAGAHPLVLRGVEMMSDAPSAACLVAGIAILAIELDRADGPRWRLVAAAPAFAAAFYIRQGHVPVIAITGVTAAILWWRRLAMRPARTIAAVAVLAALLAPHFIASVQATGSMLGSLESAAGVPYRSYVGEGLVQYLTSNPFLFYGALAAPAMVLGIAHLAWPRPPQRATIFLATIAVGQIVTLGLETRAQPRYVFVAIVLLIVVGADLVVTAGWARRWVLALVVAGWIGAIAAVVPFDRFLARAQRPLDAAAATIASDAGGRSCVVAGRQLPNLMWATRCQGTIAVANMAWPPGERHYFVSVPSGRIDITTIAPDAVELSTGNADARVWRER